MPKLPKLVIHGDADAIVPFEASGKRTAASVKGAKPLNDVARQGIAFGTWP